MQGNCTEDQLVGVGKLQLQNLANYLTIKYNQQYNFSIQDKINQNNSYFRSTYKQRTIDSLLGLVELLTNKTEIDVHTASPNKEPLRISGCSFADYYYSFVADVPEVRQYDDQMHTLAQKLGYSSDDYFEWWMAQDYFLPRRLMQMDLPQNVTQQEENMTYELTQVEWGLEYCQSDESLLQQWLLMSIGAFIPELISYINGEQQLVIVSAHEESLAPLMKIISSDFDCKEPEFGSAIEIKIFDDRTVEVDYKAKQTILQFCNEASGSLDDFINHLSGWSITWDQREQLCDQTI